MHIINPALLGGQVYPLLDRLEKWRLISYEIGESNDLEMGLAALERYLCWCKDDHINVLETADDPLSTLRKLGLEVSFAKGPQVASKRLSRILRPYRYGMVCEHTEIRIFEDPSLDAEVWDGAAQISRELVMRCTEFLGDNITAKKRKRFMQELAWGERWEFTILNDAGEFKGHALVTDLPAGVDIRLPVGSAKSEVRLVDGTAFIGLASAHGADHMNIDIQSLVNHLPFLGEQTLKQWLWDSTDKMLNSIRDSDSAAIAKTLYHLDSPEAIAAVEEYPVGAYLISGGDPHYFARVTNDVGKQYTRHLEAGTEGMRFPLPGGRAYVFPASVGQREVSAGSVELDARAGTLYVNDEDWKWMKVRCGGWDNDDCLWYLPFIDSQDGVHKVLFWRSPNQWGEYVVAEMTFDASKPTLDSSKLAVPIDEQDLDYGHIEPIKTPGFRTSGYDAKALKMAVAQHLANEGVLGRFCNILLLYAAIEGKAPDTLPASLEDIIDYTRKDIGDMSKVMGWINKTAQALAKKEVPRILSPRLASMIDSPLRFTRGHPLDNLAATMTENIKNFTGQVEGLANQCMPPVLVFEQGQEHMMQADVLRSVYGRFMRSVIEQHVPTGEDMAQAEQLVRQKFSLMPNKQEVILGLVSAIYTRGGDVIRDGTVWNCLGPELLTTLRSIGLIGEIEWDGEGAQLVYNSPPLEGLERPVGVYLKQVWASLRSALKGMPFTMEMEKAERDLMKSSIRQADFKGLALTIKGLDDRLIAYGPSGKQFAWLQKGQENKLAKGETYRVISHIEYDGNLFAVLVQGAIPGQAFKNRRPLWVSTSWAMSSAIYASTVRM